MLDSSLDTGRPVALVTGASAGIGAAFARRLAARGFDLVLTARRKERLDALGAELSAAHGVVCQTLAADLGCTKELRAVEDSIRQCDRLELLVNNAGFGTRGSFLQSDIDEQELMMRVHMTATMRLTRTALDVMLPKRSGAIINTSSVAAFATNPGSVNYGASKGWIISFTEGLHLELLSAGSPVKVQALCPGFTYTEFHDVVKTEQENSPKAFWQSAEFVVESSLKGLENGRLIVTPGWRYRLHLAVSGLAPTFLKRRMAVSAGRRMSAFGPAT